MKTRLDAVECAGSMSVTPISLLMQMRTEADTLQPPTRSRARAAAALWWGLLGVMIVFANGIIDLGMRGIATLRSGLGTIEWIVFAAVTIAFVYGEGIMALQRRWVPFLMRRVQQLPTAPVLWQLLAPFYALALVGAPSRTLVRAWAGAIAILAAVIIVRSLPDPWRGIIDFAVAAALACGLWAMLRAAGALLRRERTT